MMTSILTGNLSTDLESEERLEEQEWTFSESHKIHVQHTHLKTNTEIWQTDFRHLCRGFSLTSAAVIRTPHYPSAAERRRNVSRELSSKSTHLFVADGWQSDWREEAPTRKSELKTQTAERKHAAGEPWPLLVADPDLWPLTQVWRISPRASIKNLNMTPYSLQSEVRLWFSSFRFYIIHLPSLK